jgi:hypothetical protein
MQILKADMHMYIWISDSLERSDWVWILLWVLMFNPESKGLWVGMWCYTATKKIENGYFPIFLTTVLNLGMSKS